MKNSKRILWITLMMVLAVTAYAQQYDPESDFKAELMEGGKSVRIVGYKGEKWTVRIPPKIQDIPVTHVGFKAFSETNITNVIIPNGVTTIGNYAFNECTSLTSVTIPSSVTEIGMGAFTKCTSLTSVTIPNGVTSIVHDTFRDCTSLTSVSIPNSVTSIMNDAFSDCTSLTSVTIPNSVTSIGRFAFSDCTSLTSVTIPNSVTSIGVMAFSDCTSLTSVTIPNSVTNIGARVFFRCDSLTTINVVADNSAYTAVNGVLYNKDKSLLHTYPAGKKGNFIIPNGVTIIGEGAFSGCTNLTGVTIPNSVTVIDGAAFSDCTSLTIVTIPNSITCIMNDAFYGCTSLARVTFQGTIPMDEFDKSAFPGDLRVKFFELERGEGFVPNGIPGTYRTRNQGENAVWWKM